VDWREHVTFHEMIMMFVRFVLDQHA